MNNSLELIEENILYLKKKYSDSDNIDNLNISELEKQVNRIKNGTLFLNNIINELIEATGENLDKLLSSNHSLSYFENKLMTHYANKITSNASKSKLDSIDLCYSKDDKLSNYCQKKNFIEYAKEYFQEFRPEEFGLDKDSVINDLVEVYDRRGANEAYAVMHALENNAPVNYHEYNFNPTSQINSNNYYDFNKNTINNYQTNSEMINVNGYDYEIAQVLPKDCTKTEMLAYNFGKANIINTMRTLPDKYLELCSKGNNNTITLTASRDAMNNNANWSGYYKPSSLFGKNTNNITVDIHGSFTDNVFYTQDTLIHEMGHKFDDMSQSKSIIDWIFGTTSYTRSNSEWTDAYKKYNNVLNSINNGGYTTYPNVNEFFGDAAVAYFKNPDEIKALCPEVYSLMNKMLDGEYGYSYNEKIVAILNVS
jgi:hypothetical protein